MSQTNPTQWVGNGQKKYMCARKHMFWELYVLATILLLTIDGSLVKLRGTSKTTADSNFTT